MERLLATEEHRPAITGPLLLVLALLSAVAPFATDLYLSAFPTMTNDLHTTATSIQLTLTAFLVGIALGQLVFGPLSDRFGRLRPLVVGSALCLIASAVTALAPTVEVLIAARFAQGVTGAAGMVIGRAIISDLAVGAAAARAFSLMMLVGGIAPVVAPVLGSVLVGPVGWRGVLWVVFGIVAAMFVGVVAVVRETHTGTRRAAARSARAGSPSVLRALGSRVYLGNAVAFAFAFATMMAYISASPFVYQVMMGFNEVQYGIAFGVNALGLAGFSAISARLAGRRSVRGLAGTGFALCLTAVVVIVVVVAVGAPAWLLALPLWVAVASLGLVFGNATALALAGVAGVAGSASAVLGALQFGVGAVVSPLVGIGGEHTAVPLAVVMLVTITVACGSFLLGRERPTAAQLAGS
ncbi:multidrug effflux MFS transporter [Mycobacterium yunnanensis]|uniref:Multidrug effflux MFS transporter n=2 Tax=Mycobacterium yunnanensis TaxID=368477 RepID=A0A9X3C379_9MYCO|nr:multidrug effflux MFS transporter [Mycobacterium yunnanensis]